VLERNGAPTASVTTAVFGDLLTFDRQSRSYIYDIMADRSDLLTHLEHYFKVRERLDRHGQMLSLLALQELAEYA